MATETDSTGIESLDATLGGLMPGDNVVWIGDRTPRYERIEAAFVGAARQRHPMLVVASSQSEMRRPLEAGVDRLDATSGSPLGRPTALTDELERRLGETQRLCIAIDGLATLARRWGSDRALAFFARMCPTMLQTGALTYWRVPRELGAPFIERIRQITQCLLELRDDHVHVIKAEGRSAAIQGSAHRIDLAGDSIAVIADPAVGRLARGLLAIRRDLGLNQAQLAEAAGITPSAVSQAESGRRGLSLDTLIVLSERLGVSLDRLVGTPPPSGYRLARFDRSRVHTDGVVALADDVRLGIRSYLVSLDGGDDGVPPFAHPGIQLVAVVKGLVQVDTGDDTPVLRAGDCLVAETSGVRRWRNLRPEPAALYWILRD